MKYWRFFKYLVGFPRPGDDFLIGYLRGGIAAYLVIILFLVFWCLKH